MVIIMNEQMYEAMYEIEKKHWWFRAKRDIVLNIVAPHIDKQTQTIDFGCGTGIMIENLSRLGNVTGLDFSTIALDFCKSRFNGHLVQANLTEELPLDTKYDVGVALDVLEHLDNDLVALKNMKKVLTHNGRLIITVPAFIFLWSAHDENCNHKRRYTRKELETLIKESGFGIEYLSYYNFWLFPLILLLRSIFKLLRINKNSDIENRSSGKITNQILYKIFKSEIFFIKREIRMPFGVSIIAILRRI